jgi:UDP-N-acetylglucosamine--N-acetylmuramyl-(pentapeptide) pyrophosphoryl-undecaprenol N-acetylglucosamine transferase
MKLVAVGGGSGGHVTPVKVVIDELWSLDNRLQVIFVCDKNFVSQSREIMKNSKADVRITTILSGKFRRYHGRSVVENVLDIKSNFYNFRDMFLVPLGMLQSLILILREKPDVIFVKGGYVCLPVGLMGYLLKIPLIIHDSDSRAGLTNKVLSRYASIIATGSPLENYNYDKKKTHYIGVPIDPKFHVISKLEQLEMKRRLGFKNHKNPLVVVTGGGLGAKSINILTVKIVSSLIAKNINIYHITGENNYLQIEDEVKNSKRYASYKGTYIIRPFVSSNMHEVLGAADVIVSRAGATFVQEIAALGKSCVIIPAFRLSDQVKNSKMYANTNSAIVLDEQELESNPNILLDSLEKLVFDQNLAKKYAQNIHKNFAKPDAARKCADLIMQVNQGQAASSSTGKKSG